MKYNLQKLKLKFKREIDEMDLDQNFFDNTESIIEELDKITEKLAENYHNNLADEEVKQNYFFSIDIANEILNYIFLLDEKIKSKTVGNIE